LVLAGHRVKARRKLGVGHGDRSPAVGEIELQEIRWRQRVDQKRHVSGAHRAEKCRWVGRGVIEEQEDAAAALQAERLEAVTPAAGFRAKLLVTPCSRRADEGRAVAKTLRQIVEQDAAGV